MVCSPRVAQRCIESFTGHILFLPSHYDSTNLERYEYGQSKPKSWRVGVVCYYMLVLCSLTGLSTLLGMTQTLVAQEQLDPIDVSKSLAADFCEHLVVDTHVWRYLGGQELALRRHFEFRFGNFCAVVMYHVQDRTNGKWHLVEVYQLENVLMRWFGDRIHNAWTRLQESFYNTKEA